MKPKTERKTVPMSVKMVFSKNMKINGNAQGQPGALIWSLLLDAVVLRDLLECSLFVYWNIKNINHTYTVIEIKINAVDEQVF